MGTWSIQRVKLPLKFKWAISRGESIERCNLYITYQDGAFKGLGEVAFMTARGPSLEEVEHSFHLFIETLPKAINGLEEMMSLLETFDFENLSNLRFGLESAYVHFLAQLLEGDVPSVLGINSISKVATCYSLPILNLNQYEDFIKKHNLRRFHTLKIKIKDNDDSLKIIDKVAQCFSGSLWVDANESFDDVDHFDHFLKEVRKYHVKLIEQPFKKDDYSSYIKTKSRNDTGIMIFADESIADGDVTNDFATAFDGVNIKLMKAGGYFKALKQIRDARKLGLKVMLGCMLESSLGIMSALNISQGINYIDLDSVLFLSSDPLGLVFEEQGFLQENCNQ